MVCADAPARIDAFPWRDRPVLDVLHRHRHQPVADDRAVSLYAVAGRLVGKHAGIPAHWHAVSAAGHPDVHRLVVLGVSRQGPRRDRLSLIGVAGAPNGREPRRYELAERESVTIHFTAIHTNSLPSQKLSRPIR